MERKVAYPIILKPDEEGYYVEIPDFDIATEGNGNGQRCNRINGN